MRKIQNIVLFLVLSVVASCANGDKGDLARWSLGYTANINDYVDETIGMIVPYLQNNGLDPMELPDIIEGFEVKPLLITYSAWVKFHNGRMRGLVNVARSGNQKVNYFAKLLRIRIELQVTNVEFAYRYLVKVMNIGPTGGIVGSLNRFVVVTDILIDFNNDEIHLQQLKLQNIGRLRVRLVGNILTDWLVNPLIGVFVRVFDSIIMLVVESNIRVAAHSAIQTINSSIRDVINIIESYN